MSQYLDRNQVIELYANYQPSLANHVYEFGEKLMALPIVKIPIAELDTTNDFEERPHGEWIIRRDKRGKHIYSVCSRCNVAHLDTDFPNFCPNCGSDNRPRILDEAVDGEGKDGNEKEGERNEPT